MTLEAIQKNWTATTIPVTYQVARLSLLILLTLITAGCQSNRMGCFKPVVTGTPSLSHPAIVTAATDEPNQSDIGLHHVNYRQPLASPLRQDGLPPQSTSSDSRSNVRSLLDRSDNSRLPGAQVQGIERVDPRQLGESDMGNADPSLLVKDLVITGNRRVPTHQITRQLSTRAGRYFDPDRLQEDVEKIWRMPDINRVNGPYLERTPEGVIISLEVKERNIIEEVKFIGNRGLTDRQLRRESGIDAGAAMDAYQIRMAKSRIEELYKTKGFPRTQVEILSGDQVNDDAVVFLIHEDQKQRIWKAEFEGNTVAPDGRLRSLIESKPGILKLFGGLVNRDSIEQDILKLTNYYRSLGYFNARIGREIQESGDGRWMTIRFIIDEGPRYRVRDVRFMGNQAFRTDQLEMLVTLRPEDSSEPEFNVAKMNADVAALRDLYGSQGYVFADVVAEPRFLEEPGQLDIVYRIDEGKQYRVGDINVYFEGNYGITRREVVMNRLSLRPGELIDIREIRDSERRMRSAQIFADQTTGSPGPRIVIRPPELKELERHASQGSMVR